MRCEDNVRAGGIRHKQWLDDHEPNLRSVRPRSLYDDLECVDLRSLVDVLSGHLREHGRLGVE
jgi:hypothetical protein